MPFEMLDGNAACPDAAGLPERILLVSLWAVAALRVDTPSTDKNIAFSEEGRTIADNGHTRSRGEYVAGVSQRHVLRMGISFTSTDFTEPFTRVKPPASALR